MDNIDVYGHPTTQRVRIFAATYAKASYVIAQIDMCDALEVDNYFHNPEDMDAKAWIDARVHPDHGFDLEWTLQDRLGMSSNAFDRFQERL